MFKNILVPISSEFYSKDTLKRSVFLAEMFDSKLTFAYIIEEKMLNKTNKLVDSYITAIGKEKTKKEIINKYKQTADGIIFEEAQRLLKGKEIFFKEKILKGEFSDAIKREVDMKKYDLILMGFEKECLLNYRLLKNLDIPVWIERKGESKKILAICSNLAPNQKVPEISIKLSEILKWKLHIGYIVDIEDAVQVDENGIRSDKKSEKNLLLIGKKFTQEMKEREIKSYLIKGNLERETLKLAKKINANLVIVGREQKKKGLLGLPVKNLKRKLAEKCEYSILFIN
ncbi:MAG: universal stress protein [Thermoplasmatales archaeon]|nr:MAG: universal stress protein [Thermoplasmatales archaeon]